MSIDNSNHLPVGFQLGDFSIKSIAGDGGFSIVYLAEDTFLGRTVAIKEYLPTSVAARGRDLVTVQPRSDNAVAGFQAGLRSFIREAKLLAQFSHPAIVEVYRVWEQNGTAYIAMRFLRGETLSHHIRNEKAFSEDKIRIVLEPIFDAIELLHAQRVIHRDVSPDNIILADGHPVLLDLGAARVVVGGLTQALTSVLKPGYAPIEQYADDGSLKQGTWTDVYAIAGVLYKLATGVTPVQAIGRVVGDPLQSLKSFGGNFSEAFAESVMAGLTVFPEHRIKTVGELRERLGWHVVSTQLVTTRVRTIRNHQSAEIVVQTPTTESLNTAHEPVEFSPPKTQAPVEDERTVVFADAKAFKKIVSSQTPNAETVTSAQLRLTPDDDRTVVTEGALTKAKLFSREPTTMTPTPEALAELSTWATAAAITHFDQAQATGPSPAAGANQPEARLAMQRSSLNLDTPAPSGERAAHRSSEITKRWWYGAFASLGLLLTLFGTYRIWLSGSRINELASGSVAKPPTAIVPRSDLGQPVVGSQAPQLVSPASPPSPYPPPLPSQAPLAVRPNDSFSSPPAKSPPSPQPAAAAPKSAATAAAPNKTNTTNERIASQGRAPISLPSPPAVSTSNPESKLAAPNFNGTWLGDLDCPASTGPDAGTAPAFRRRVTGVVSNGELVITREVSVREEFSGALRSDGRVMLTGTGYRVADPTYRWKASGSARADATREPLRIDGSVKLEKIDSWTTVCAIQLTKE